MGCSLCVGGDGRFFGGAIRVLKLDLVRRPSRQYQKMGVEVPEKEKPLPQAVVISTCLFNRIKRLWGYSPERIRQAVSLHLRQIRLANPLAVRRAGHQDNALGCKNDPLTGSPMTYP
jgi:hypothetical protein